MTKRDLQATHGSATAREPHADGSVLRALANYAASLRETLLPDAVVHSARRCLVDWTAATVPGGLMDPAVLLRRALADEIGHGRAILIPTGEPATLRTAALINGTAAHTAECDDIYRDALYHPGAPVIAAALAAAQVRRASGRRLLEGIVSGYEVSTRIGAAINPAHYAYWHTTGTVGTIGAAAAAATIFGLDATRTLHALANAGTLAAGLQQAIRRDGMSKPLHAGHAAEAGTLVAQAAEHGFTGAADILDGPRGLGRAMSNAPDWSGAVADLGRTFNIQSVTVKNHAACGHVHVAIDAVRALRQAHGLSPASVARIRVGTYAAALEIAGHTAPTTPFEAQFSIAYGVAVALATGSARLHAFTAARLDDPDVREVMSKVTVDVDAQAEALYPKQRSATVVIHTTDGRELAYRAPTRKGDPDWPLTDDELTEKFAELVGPVLGAEGAGALLEWLLAIDEAGDVTRVPLVPAGGGHERGGDR